jgi:hypothetical protein
VHPITLLQMAFNALILAALIGSREQPTALTAAQGENTHE